MAFDLFLIDPGDKKIQVIKEVRAVTSLGLKEAKDLVDRASAGIPSRILRDVNDQTAQRYRNALEGAGALVELRNLEPPTHEELSATTKALQEIAQDLLPEVYIEPSAVHYSHPMQTQSGPGWEVCYGSDMLVNVDGTVYDINIASASNLKTFTLVIYEKKYTFDMNVSWSQIVQAIREAKREKEQ